MDASDTHLGAVLQQLLDRSWAPLAFYSKKLSDAEKKYSAFNRELLAASSSLRHFRFMLEGRDFTIFMDHTPLTHALFRVSLPWSACKQCHRSYLAEFNSYVVHIPGPEKIVADALSRPSLVSAPSASALVSLVSQSPSLFQPSPSPSPPFSVGPVVPSFFISHLPLLQITCPSVSEMKPSPSLSMVSVPC